MIKTLLTIINTLLSAGMAFLLTFFFVFTDGATRHYSTIEVITYIVELALLIISVVASWTVVFKSPESISRTWKILSFASLPVFAYLFQEIVWILPMLI